MNRLTDIVTLCIGTAALVTLVYAKDRSTPTPGVRSAIELIGNGVRGTTMHSGGPELTLVWGIGVASHKVIATGLIERTDAEPVKTLRPRQT